MYNRYIPQDTSYVRVEEPAKASPPPPPDSGGRPSGGNSAPRFRGVEDLFSKRGLGGLLGGRDGGLHGLLRALKLDNIDTGDVLLLLIILLLLSEGDDLDLVVALGVVLLMSLGEEKKEKDGT